MLKRYRISNREAITKLQVKKLQPVIRHSGHESYLLHHQWICVRLCTLLHLGSNAILKVRVGNRAVGETTIEKKTRRQVKMIRKVPCSWLRVSCTLSELICDKFFSFFRLIASSLVTNIVTNFWVRKQVTSSLEKTLISFDNYKKIFPGKIKKHKLVSAGQESNSISWPHLVPHFALDAIWNYPAFVCHFSKSCTNQKIWAFGSFTAGL